ncbi:MAG: putative metal-binding motif-containing protein [Myxococcota bacterium]
MAPPILASRLVLASAFVLGIACQVDEAAEDPDCTGTVAIRTSDRTICRENADCSDGVYCNGIELCRSTGAVCECAPGVPPCPEGVFCDEATGACLFECDVPPDQDDDEAASIACGGLDCDDTDPTRSPFATEVCDADGKDEDCNPETFGDVDADGDGFVDARCFNVDGSGRTVSEGRDCDDTNPAVHPIQLERCNGVDDDCDGDVDEGVRSPLFADMDGDGWGVEPAIEGCAPQAGFSLIAGDCDDENAVIHPDVVRCIPPEERGNSAICLDDGTWQPRFCPDRGVCLPLSDGTGICLPAT